MNSRDTLVTELNTLEDFNPIVPESFKDAPIVMLGNLHPLTQSSVIDQMTVKPKLVILDTMKLLDGYSSRRFKKCDQKNRCDYN